LQALYGYKTYAGAMALIFLALGGALQSFSDGTEIDWNRTVNDTLIGVTVFGAAYRAGKSQQK
jgi:hypothetical protein